MDDIEAIATDLLDDNRAVFSDAIIRARELLISQTAGALRDSSGETPQRATGASVVEPVVNSLIATLRSPSVRAGEAAYALEAWGAWETMAPIGTALRQSFSAPGNTVLNMVHALFTLGHSLTVKGVTESLSAEQEATLRQAYADLEFAATHASPEGLYCAGDAARGFAEQLKRDMKFIRLDPEQPT